MPKTFPFFNQLNSNDCGATCLRMVAKHFGRNYSLNQLKKQTFTGISGVTLKDVSDAAEAIGLHTVGVLIKLEQLQEAPMPCIVHWEQNHFVVVYKITKQKVYVADPAFGKATLSHSQFSQRWIPNHSSFGVALLLETTPRFFQTALNEDNPRSIFDSIRFYLWKYRIFLYQILIGLFLISAIQLILPFLTQSIVDVGINTKNVKFIYLVLTGQVVLFITRSLIDFIRGWLLLHLSGRINISLISDFVIKITQLPLSFFNDRNSGEILQRLQDHSKIESFLSNTTLSIAFSIFNVSAFGLVLLIYSFDIFLVVFVSSIVYVLYLRLFLKKREELDYKLFRTESVNKDNILELLQGMPDIKLNNCETEKRWEWERIQATLFNLKIASTKLSQYQFAGSLFINEAKNILVTFIAAQQVIDGEITLGMMLAIQFIIGYLNTPVQEFGLFLRSFQDAKLAMARVKEIYDEEGEEQNLDTVKSSTVVPSNEDVIFENVSFSYGGSNDPKTLDSISLRIPKGKITAIVGKSGSGKSTLLKLLLKFYNTYTGNIKIGDVDLRWVNSSNWRQVCNAVIPNGHIFFDSFANNIALGRSEINYEKLLHASKIANIHDYIESHPLKYDSKINHKQLSDGQRQRLLIARAIYNQPHYLFFDEATSFLDASNERQIVENLRNLFSDKTVIIIAHRLSTIKNSDQIVVMDNGRIVESGTHNELVSNEGYYFELVKNQLD